MAITFSLRSAFFRGVFCNHFGNPPAFFMDLQNALLGLAVFYLLAIYGGSMLSDNGFLLIVLAMGVAYWIFNH